MLKKILFLIIAVGIAIVAVFVQQIFDNDFPYSVSLNLPEKTYSLSLPKINEGVVDCIIELTVPDPHIHGYVYFKLYNSNSSWKRVKLLRLNDKLVCILPYQKPMVKLQYYLELYDERGAIYPIHKNQPLVVLFKGYVPRLLAYLIALLFFGALVVSNYLGFVTVVNIPHFVKYVRLVFYLLLTVIILELIAYLLAYRHILVTLSPHNDMRFFKNLIIFSLWAVLFYVHRKGHEMRFATLMVSLLTLVLFCLPDHFVFQPFF